MSEFERERNINFLISKINNEVDTYLSREPRPSLTMIADYFGFSDLVEVNLRKKSMTLHIPDLKKRLVEIGLKKAMESDLTTNPIVFPEYLPDTTITPSDDGEINISGSGVGLEILDVIPRSQYLVELFTEKNIVFERPFAGKNTSTMVRGDHSYYFYYLPDLKIAISVNNQEGNKTFIFYNVPTREDVREKLLSLTKSQYENKECNPFEFYPLDWTGDVDSWKERIYELCTKEVPKYNGLSNVKKNVLDRRLNQLLKAYEIWSNGDRLKKFNTEWLKMHGFAGLYEFARIKGGINDLVDLSSPEVQAAFEKREPYEEKTVETATQEFLQAYDKWKNADKKFGFNPDFLRNQGFEGLYKWINRNGGFERFICKFSFDVQNSFEIQQHEKFDEIQFLKKFQDAYEQWNSLPLEKKPLFNHTWLRKNGYDKLRKAVKRHYGNFETFLSRASEDVRKNFVNKRYKSEE